MYGIFLSAARYMLILFFGVFASAAIADIRLNKKKSFNTYCLLYMQLPDTACNSAHRQYTACYIVLSRNNSSAAVSFICSRI